MAAVRGGVMYRTTRLVSESRGHEEGEGPKEGVRSEKIMRRNENSMGGLTSGPRKEASSSCNPRKEAGDYCKS